MRWVAAALLVAAVVAAAVQWPLVTSVETGLTPQYPDLQPWTYAASEERVRRAATAAVEKLPRWTFVGSGRGPRGAEVRAVHRNPIPWFAQDVTVSIRRRGARTEVSARSVSRRALWDLGQNARNVRALRRALDGEIGPS